MDWFRGSAGDRLADSLQPRKAPKPPRSKQPKHPMQKHKQKAPGVRNPVPGQPFSDPGRKPKSPSASINSVAVSHTDRSPEAISSLLDILEKSGDDVSNITWVILRASNDDDGWCKTLSEGSYYDFDDLYSRAYEKPFEDSNAPDEGLMAVSHAGCLCHLIIETENGVRYKITTQDPYPQRLN